MHANSKFQIPNSKINYILHLADNTLILAQRNSEWCGHGPVLEQDIAITNITLDLIGQARNFYQYAAQIVNEQNSNSDTTEDSLAYLRNEQEYKNCLLCEQPIGDWAVSILRQFFFSAYQFLLYQKMQNGADTQLAAIAEKALKEVTYHVRWSSEWVIRLGDGTEESRKRLLKAIDDLWMYTGELFVPASYEHQAVQEGYGIDVAFLKDEWIQVLKNVFSEASVQMPKDDVWMQRGGKEGRHTEHLGYILTEMQYLQRVYPGCEW